MTIKSAILALSPFVYWPLDETSGTNVHDEGSAGKAGTISGDYAWGVSGAEIGTTGVRLFAGASIIGPGMGLSSFTDYTIMFFATAPANGNQTAQADILGIGDYSNHTLRGIRVTLLSSTADSLTFFLRIAPSGSTSNAASPPRTYWHNYAWVNNVPSANNVTPYYDGTPQASAVSTGTTYQAIDPLWIQGNSAIVLSHVAWWNRKLSQAEIQSVANQIQPWPYYIPGNQVPGGGGSGGGLTSDQAAQLTDIQHNTDTMLPQVAQIPGMSGVLNTVKSATDYITGVVNDIKGFWEGYESVTLPDLQNVLSNITDSVTATIQTSTGDIAQSIGSLLSGHSLEHLTLNDITDGGTCARVNHPLGGWMYGIIIRIYQIPPNFVPLTPAQDWYVPDLAVVNIYRGADNFYRAGVHSTNWVVSPFPVTLPAVISDYPFMPVPPDTYITVDWAPGVCGQVYLMNTP